MSSVSEGRAQAWIAKTLTAMRWKLAKAVEDLCGELGDSYDQENFRTRYEEDGFGYSYDLTDSIIEYTNKLVNKDNMTPEILKMIDLIIRLHDMDIACRTEAGAREVEKALFADDTTYLNQILDEVIGVETT